MIGLSAVLLLVLNCCIAGISGIVGGLFRAIDARLVTSAVVGLVLGPLLSLGMLVGMIAHDRLIRRLITTEPMKGARP